MEARQAGRLVRYKDMAKKDVSRYKEEMKAYQEQQVAAMALLEQNVSATPAKSAGAGTAGTNGSTATVDRGSGVQSNTPTGTGAGSTNPSDPAFLIPPQLQLLLQQAQAQAQGQGQGQLQGQQTGPSPKRQGTATATAVDFGVQLSVRAETAPDAAPVSAGTDQPAGAGRFHSADDDPSAISIGFHAPSCHGSSPGSSNGAGAFIDNPCWESWPDRGSSIIARIPSRHGFTCSGGHFVGTGSVDSS